MKENLQTQSNISCVWKSGIPLWVSSVLFLIVAPLAYAVECFVSNIKNMVENFFSPFLLSLSFYPTFNQSLMLDDWLSELEAPPPKPALIDRTELSV